MRPEQQIQKAVIVHLRVRGVSGLVYTHCPNGGFRRPIEAAIFKSLGLRACVSDLLLWHRAKSYALELKAEGGRATAAQLKFIEDMRAAGAEAAISEGLDRALAILESWGLLRGAVR